MSLFMPGTSVKMLATLQRNDPAFSKVFDNLKGKKSYQHFFLHDEVFFRKCRLGNGILVDQMAIPESLAPQIIKNFHQQNFYSHLGLAGMKRHLEAVFLSEDLPSWRQKLYKTVFSAHTIRFIRIRSYSQGLSSLWMHLKNSWRWIYAWSGRKLL